MKHKVISLLPSGVKALFAVLGNILIDCILSGLPLALVLILLYEYIFSVKFHFKSLCQFSVKLG